MNFRNEKCTTNFFTVAFRYFKRINEYFSNEYVSVIYINLLTWININSLTYMEQLLWYYSQYSTSNRLSQTTEKKRLDDDARVIAQTSLGHFLPSLEVKSLSSTNPQQMEFDDPTVVLFVECQRNKCVFCVIKYYEIHKLYIINTY